MKKQYLYLLFIILCIGCVASGPAIPVNMDGKPVASEPFKPSGWEFLKSPAKSDLVLLDANKYEAVDLGIVVETDSCFENSPNMTGVIYPGNDLDNEDGRIAFLQSGRIKTACRAVRLFVVNSAVLQPTKDVLEEELTVNWKRTAPANKPRQQFKTTKTPAELFKAFAPSVVSVYAVTSDSIGSGTGFVVERNGLIATNYHVIAGASVVLVTFKNGSKYNVEAFYFDPSKDLALLIIDIHSPLQGPVPNVPPLVLGNSNNIVIGERVVAIGNPLDLEYTLTDGLVSGIRSGIGNVSSDSWIQMSTPIQHGSSGGPLFNMNGEVIGINTRGSSRWSAGNFAIPVNYLRVLINNFKASNVGD